VRVWRRGQRQEEALRVSASHGQQQQNERESANLLSSMERRALLRSLVEKSVW
jgi:hypothetical protein